MFRNHLICIVFTLISGFSFSQATVQGTLTDQITGNPLSGIEVKTSFPDKSITDDKGNFSVRHRSDEAILLFIEWQNGLVEWKSNMLATATVNVGTVTITTNQDDVKDELPTIILEENDPEEGSNISGLLRTGDDL